MGYAAWMPAEATLMEHGDAAWEQACQTCGRMFRLAEYSYWCDDCYEYIARDEPIPADVLDELARIDRRECYECGEPVREREDIGLSYPMHTVCSVWKYGDVGL